MVLPGLREERPRVPSPTSPKITKSRRRDFPVPRRQHQRHADQTTGDAGISCCEGRRSPVTKFDDSTVGSSSQRIYDGKKLLLDLNEVVKEEEEARESPFADEGSEKKSKCSSLKRAEGAVNLPKRRSDSCMMQSAKLCVQLSREEIEEDFLKMTGRWQPRKPKKRPSVVQKQLDTLFPGLMLKEVTADLYEVPEPPVRQFGKRKRKRNRNRNGNAKDV